MVLKFTKVRCAPYRANVSLIRAVVPRKIEPHPTSDPPKDGFAAANI